MTTETVTFEDTSSFSKLFLDYVNGSRNVNGIFAFEPSPAGFEQALSNRQFPQKNRDILVEVLKEQYGSSQCNPDVVSNIELLGSEKTFTVTTGHQLNIFTGPLFFIYKIAATINIARDLAAKFPEYNFVPVYWMASEDHDFEEINHVYQHGVKHVWETQQEGAVGRFETGGLPELANQLEGRTEVFKQAYEQGGSLADAVRCYTSKLFSDTGLVIIDADDARLKSLMVDIFKDDLINHSAFHNVNTRSSEISEKGYKPQINPREINLFYLDNGLRKRIVRSGDGFQIHETDTSFSQEELLDLLQKSPEKFSPNVIMRPIYQEVILPNLGYIGGPAELAYWLQLKSAFDFYKVDFPVLMPRIFGLYLDSRISRKIHKLDLTNEELFLGLEALKKRFLSEELNNELSLDDQYSMIEKVFEEISVKAGNVDQTLIQHVKAQAKGVNKSVSNIQAKMLTAEKRKREDEMRMIAEVHEYVYPGGTPQERKVNILEIQNENFVADILSVSDPFELKYNIFRD